ncbi:MAG TPA: hypothetical protein DCX54_02345 [Flavobacteriales bacterium]|nr:hypothetical protein [Flavobacteriales bacterium]
MNKILVILSLLTSSLVWSQSTTISPFSRINIGDVDGAVFSRNVSMGRLAYGLSGPLNVNPYNPATYSELVWTNFEAAAMSKNYWLTGQNQSQSANKTLFNHLALGIPIAEWCGASFGLMPVSQVGYDYIVSSALKTDSTNVPFENSFFGSGGLNKVYIGSGFNLAKKYFFGFNFSYYFGDMQYEEVIVFTESNNYLNTGALKRVDAGDIYLDFGFMYKLKLQKKWNVNLGLVFVPTQGIRTKQSEFNFTYSGDQGTARVIDTVSFEENASNSIILPPKLGLGVLLSRSEKFSFGVDLEYVKWSVSNYNTINGLNDVLTIRTGAEYTGKDNGYKLRMGLRYGQLPISLTNPNDKSEIKLDEVALSFGVVVPIRSKDKLTLTEMNFGAEIGKRGKNVTGALLEQYINVHVGLTLNNKWFIKRKYD